MGGIANKSLNDLLKQPGITLFNFGYLQGSVYDPTAVYILPAVDIALSTYGAAQHQPVENNILVIKDVGVTFTETTTATCAMIIGTQTDDDKFFTATIPIGTAGTTLSWIRGDFALPATAKESDGQERVRCGEILICQTPATAGSGSFIPWIRLAYENNNVVL